MDNIALSALRRLVHDGTCMSASMLPRSYRSECQQQFAQNRDFKEQGREFFRVSGTGKRSGFTRRV